MKCSEATKHLEALIATSPKDPLPDVAVALKLALECLYSRMALKNGWALSEYRRLPGEDDE